ncbi:Xaa-Pro peptidase family protein [Leisingera aquaemixtae]|uniref:M24 family metallopeptidase n=1 Tax=Leisingera aquaemixtae TaxID=1396826 RepID=UPI001C98A1AD|nr:Xaa-Pro peptidase family protein [Leisingera aquaemixtae]MBY6068828.1 Xaa-Pro peptidase family protein [Leisingera aquaemixtae]
MPKNKVISNHDRRWPVRMDRQEGPVQHGALDHSDAPADLDDVRRYRLGRLQSEMQRQDVPALLLLDPINTRYATDCTNMQIWCMHFETRCVFVPADGPVTLLDYADMPFLAEGLPTVDKYGVMKAHYFFAAGNRMEEWAEAFGTQIGGLMARYCPGEKRLAIDRLSHLGGSAIQGLGFEIVDGQSVAEVARSIKSPGELELMKAAIAVADKGMHAMRDALRPGITENALWAKLHAVNIAEGGEWIETRLLASGPRTNPWFHESSMRVIEAGDMVSFDTDLVGPYGYCADISRAWVCGDVWSREQAELYQLAREQVEFNMEVIRPGMSYREIAEKSWPIPDRFKKNRYGCLAHGVGLCDEYPSLPYREDLEEYGYDGVVEPGMVLAVESYIGEEGAMEGVKLEQMIHVTETGWELLSHYPWEEFEA